jgi:hypothetical protein
MSGEVGGVVNCLLSRSSLVLGLHGSGYLVDLIARRMKGTAKDFFARVGARQVLPGLQEVNAIMASTPYTLHDKSLPHSNHLG